VLLEALVPLGGGITGPATLPLEFDITKPVHSNAVDGCLEASGGRHRHEDQRVLDNESK
jgi:hypothetical protein